MNKKISYTLWFLLILSIDRITKYFALGMIKTYIVNKFLAFQLVFNRGISCGLFHSNEHQTFAVLTVAILGIIAMLLYYTYKRAVVGRTIYAEIAVLAGALSNVVDRVLYAGVIDFIHVHVGDWSFPIFNVADMAIVLGICWMIKEQYTEQ